MANNGYVRKHSLPRSEQDFLRRVGQKLRRELDSRGETLETLARNTQLARSAIRDVLLGRSDTGILTLRAIAQGLGYPSVRRFLEDIET